MGRVIICGFVRINPHTYFWGGAGRVRVERISVRVSASYCNSVSYYGSMFVGEIKF